MTFAYPLTSLAAHPPRLSPGYKSTVKRSPQKPLIIMRHTLSELTGPVYGHETVRENDHDLTIQHKAEPLGERIIVHGHVLDEDGRGVPLQQGASTHNLQRLAKGMGWGPEDSSSILRVYETMLRRKVKP